MSGIKKKTVLSAVIINAVLVVAAVLFASVKRSDLIIYFGVNGAGVLVTVGWIVFAVLAVGLNALWIIRAARRGGKAGAGAPPILEYMPSSGHMDPAEIRTELLKYRGERPALAQYLERAVAQMDSMDRKQEKLKELFRRNQVGSLGDVDATLDDTEQAMCGNFVKIINRAILWDPLEWNKPEKQEIYSAHAAYILQMLERNDEVLLMCDQLLSETVSYVDEKQTQPDASRMHLEVMTETIQSLRKMNTSEDFGI